MTADVHKIDWFADRDDESYRDEARNILDSYAHPWDVLAELAQNSVDAISEIARGDKQVKGGEIRIDINQEDRSITFVDNGIGIGSETLKKVLNPHFSRKRNKQLKGEKGVGLTYIALMGNSFDIRTKSDGEAKCLSVKGVQGWMQGNDTRPQIEIGPIAKDPFPKWPSYTQVTVSGIPEPVAADDELDIFSLSIAQLAFLLRSRTALGFTGVLYGNQPNPVVNASLTLHSPDGSHEKRAIPFAFAAPADFLPKKSVITLDEVKRFLSEAEEKRVYGKSIQFHRVFQTKAGREVKAYCLLTSRHVYNQISEDLNLPEDIRMQGGIYVATKGMPTGIVLTTPKTGRAGYWPNFFLVLEYDHITLDLGRKSITAPRTIQMLQRQAAELFNDVDKYIKYSIREDEGTLDAAISADELSAELTKVKQEDAAVFESANGKTPNGKFPKELPFCRQPTQEQDVIAVFCMVLARGGLPYEMLRISSNYRYDCFLQFLPERTKRKVSIVAEFKFLGESILRDLGDAKARYGQLNLLICWEMDERRLKEAGFIVDTIEEGKNELPGATHKLSFPSSAGVKDQPIAVICLRRLVGKH